MATIYVARKDIKIMSTGFIREKGSLIGAGEIPDGIRETMIEEGTLVLTDSGRPVEEVEAEGYAAMSKAELKELCAERELSVGGNVTTLIKRLEDYDAEDAPDEAPEDGDE